MMQSSKKGVSITDIEDEFGVSRRTAERMRDAVLGIFPDAVTTVEKDKTKFWKLSGKTPINKIYFEKDELALMDLLRRLFESEGLKDKADGVKGIIKKMKAVNKL